MISDSFQHIRRIQIKTTKKVDSLFAGDYHSAFKGVGLEFEDVREYQSGDDVHRINWHLTARMQRPFVKNFQEERELTVMLLVDVSASTLFGSGELTKNEMIAEIGALLAFSAIKNQDKVGLILFSNEMELYLAPQRNLRHVLRVIRELLFFKPKHSGTDIKNVLSFFGRIQKKRTICFLISDFLSNGFEKEAAIISKHHDLILLNIHDAFEEKFPDLGLAELSDLESKEKVLIDTSDKTVQDVYVKQSQNRKAFLKQLSTKIKADLISIQSNQSYVDTLHRFFKSRRKR